MTSTTNDQARQLRAIRSERCAASNRNACARSSESALKHRIAAERLVQALEASAPKPVHEWGHFARIDNTAWDKTAPQIRVSNHIADMVQYRSSAPHTLVAPMVDRRRIRYWLSEDVQFLLPDLEEVELHVRGRLAAELAWRLDIGHFGVPDEIEPVLRAALHPDYGVDPEERLLILRLLGYNAIEHRQWEELQTFLKALAASDLEPYDGAAWGAYLRCLAARENFDLAAIADNLDGVSGDDPVWSLRRAAMLCEVCESESAGLAIRDCLRDLSHRRGRDRKSLWLISREAWARFVWYHLIHSLEPGAYRDDVGRENQAEYYALSTDPWDEFNTFEFELRSEQDRARRNSPEEKSHFEAGSWTPARTEAPDFVLSWPLTAEMQLRRLADFVGIPRSAPSLHILDDRLCRSVWNETQPFESLVWRRASYMRMSVDEYLNRWFGRIGVAAIPNAIIGPLISQLSGAVAFQTTKLADKLNSREDVAAVLASSAELLSRLAVRADPETARELVRQAFSIFTEHGGETWRIRRPLGSLLKRSLTAIPPSERGSMLATMLDFPLPGEFKSEGLISDWPDIAECLSDASVDLRRAPHEFGARVAQLIGWVARDRDASRYHALLRLDLLYRRDLLSPKEVAALADAIWQWRSSPDGLPTDTYLYPGFFARLPEPIEGLWRNAFHLDIIQPLLAGEEPRVEHGIYSISYIGDQLGRDGQVPWTPAVAMKLIRAVLNRPEPGEKERDLHNTALAFALLPGTPLDDELALALWQRVKRAESPTAILLVAAVVHHDAGYREPALAELRRALASRRFQAVENGLTAIRDWSKLTPAGQFPQSLASAIAAQVDMRREPALFRALDLALDLVHREQFAPEDITRLINGLVELEDETDYAKVRPGTFLSATLTYIRANAFRLARLLSSKGIEHPTILKWLELGRTDALPEVRYVVDRKFR